MKRIALLLALIAGMITVQAQVNPVNWTFTAKKISDKTYEVHMTASIESGWHLFSQTQPEDNIGIPTGFTITKNPLVTLDGKIKEVGKVEKFHDEKLGVSANQYSQKVDFVQVIKLKGSVKTNFAGAVEYQTCNDQRCLPPKTVNFNIALQ